MEAFAGNGFNPRRTIPRTMCLTSASGCSAVNFALETRFDSKSDQLVLDSVKKDLCFTFCGFAE